MENNTQLSDKSSKKFQKELNSGTISLLLLATIAKEKSAMYGYQIAKSLELSDTGVSNIKQGALYPVLRSLNSSGLLSSKIEPSVSGPPRKYYEITSKGKKALTQWIKIWKSTTSTVNRVISGVQNEKI